MFEEIKQDLINRLKGQTDSRHATADEVRIAWLLNEVERLREENKFLKDKITNQVDKISNQVDKENLRRKEERRFPAISHSASDVYCIKCGSYYHPKWFDVHVCK